MSSSTGSALNCWCANIPAFLLCPALNRQLAGLKHIAFPTPHLPATALLEPRLSPNKTTAYAITPPPVYPAKPRFLGCHCLGCMA
jgi:hypothetical protein